MAKISELPVVANPTGTETVVVLDGNETRRVDMGPLVDAAAAPALDRAATQADRAEAGALAALLSVADGVYDDDVAGGLANTAPDGSEAFYNVDPEGYLDVIANNGGTARTIVSLPTRKSMRANGINLWEVARRGASTDPRDMAETTAAINSVLEDASRWGVGVVHCGGADKVYHCGGDYVNFGTVNLKAKDKQAVIPFRRGRIRIQSNVELRGASKASRARFIAAPGDRDPGGLFFVPFWEPNPRRTNFAIRWIELDANRDRQTYSQYAANTSDGNQWIQGHAIAAGSLENFTAEGCKIHGWWGHAFFGFSALDFGGRTENWQFIDNDVYDNMQGGAQLEMNRVRSVRNRWHGDGGWTALGLNIETHTEAALIHDIWSVDDVFDGRDGWSTGLATVRDWNGVAGVDTDSAQALARRTRYRRGMWLSGNYGVIPPDKRFQRQRGRIRIINPTCWQASIGGGGFDRIHVTNLQSESTYEDVRGHWPPMGSPVDYTFGLEDQITGFDQFVLRDAMVNCDYDGPAINVGNFRKASISAHITGGRGAGVRLAACGGKVEVQAENIGKATDRAFWKSIFPNETDAQADARIGSTSAAVVAFGTRGPLEIEVMAVDTRGAAAQMQAAAYLNVGVDNVVGVRGSSEGHKMRPLIDVNDNVFDRGLIGAAERTQTMRGPVEVRGPMTVLGSITLDAKSGPADLTLKSGAAPGRISFVQNNGLEGQLIQLINGDMQIQIHDKGALTGVPMVATNAGALNFTATWDAPCRTANGIFLWVTAAGVWRTSLVKPTAEDSGDVLGTQA